MNFEDEILRELRPERLARSHMGVKDCCKFTEISADKVE